MFLEVDSLVFKAPPKPLDEDVIHPSTTPVHADLDALLLKLGDPLFSGELAALIRVENLWFATSASQRLFQSAHAKGAVHRVADFPCKNVHCARPRVGKAPM